MPPLRVLEVLEATEGGTRTHFRDLVLGLPPERFRVDVAVSVQRDPGFAADLDRFRERGVGVHVGPMVRSINALADARALAWLRGLLRAGRYQVIHGHSSKAGFLARLAGALEGVPVRLYTPNAFHFQNPETGGAARWLTIRLERLAARWGSGLICVSGGEREAALAARIDSPERLYLIPNGIDLARLDQQPHGGGRLDLDLSEEALVVLTVGRRVPQKGDRYLLAAWPTVAAALPAARLVIVGDGPLRPGLERQAAELGVADSVVFVPRREEVAPLYAAADLYVLPSLYEGAPYTLMEAMAMGLPCVATAVAGARDLWAAGAPLVLVPPADPPALAAALLRALGCPASGPAGERGRRLVRSRYRADQMVATIAELYQRLARQPRMTQISADSGRTTGQKPG